MELEQSAEIIGHIITQARKATSPELGVEALCDQSGVSKRTLAKIEAGDPSVSLSRYLSVADILNVTWLFEVFQTPSAGKQMRYLTGLSALNLFVEGRDPAYWHTSQISNVRAWSIAGVNFSSTQWLLGVRDIFKANNSLNNAGVHFDVDVYAASYERAVFDLLYEFIAIREKPIPNIQARDIDDAVDFNKVMNWIEQSSDFIDHDKIKRMKTWLRNSDYEFNGESEAA